MSPQQTWEFSEGGFSFHSVSKARRAENEAGPGLSGDGSLDAHHTPMSGFQIFIKDRELKIHLNKSGPYVPALKFQSAQCYIERGGDLLRHIHTNTEKQVYFLLPSSLASTAVFLLLI